jgi:hypothetical protein
MGLSVRAQAAAHGPRCGAWRRAWPTGGWKYRSGPVRAFTGRTGARQWVASLADHLAELDHRLQQIDLLGVGIKLR